jgi:ABC-type branched-subunit amino acid transport system ATPase component/ABC-type branched-subunit amino acid transport system permease subunit
VGYLQYTIALGGIYAVIAISYQLVLSAGIMQACQAALVGIGAYTGAVLTANAGVPFWIGVIGAGAASAAVGLPLSILSLRLGHFFLAVATLGFAEVVIVLILNSSYLGEAVGFSSMPLATTFLSVAIVLAATLLLALRLQNSRLGHTLRAIADDEIAASSLGIHVNRERVRIFVVSSAFAGIGGALLAHLTGIIVPSDLGFAATVTFMVMVVLGGVTTPLGAFFGAAILTALPELLRFSTSSRMILYGVIVVAMMIFRPRGVIHRVRNRHIEGNLRHALRGAASRLRIARTEAAAADGRPSASPATHRVLAPAREGGRLETVGIAKSFGGLEVLRDVTLSLTGGEILGVIGPNGAGKTTFFNLVSGIDRPDAGQILLDGEDLTDAPAHRRAGLGIARTFQTSRLFAGMTCLENVVAARYCRTRSGLWQTALMLPSERRERRESLQIAAAQLESVGLADVMGQMAVDLPYGMRRRLEIARALVTEPRFLLLDEPTAGMNEAEEADFEELVRAIASRGIGVLLIEHNVALVAGLCDRMVVLNAGHILASGTPDECLEDASVVEAYLGAPMAA